MGSHLSQPANNLRDVDQRDDTMTAVNIDELRDSSKSEVRSTIEGLSRVLKERNEQDSVDQRGTVLLKQVFKKMDPAITYDTNYSSQGQLVLAFKYNRDKGILLVKLIRALNLNAKSLRGSCASIYIKVFLQNSSNDTLINTTKVIRGTIEPIFHEIFTFPLKEDVLNDEILVCQAWNADVMEQDELIGEVTIPTRSLNLTQNTIYTDTYHLKAQNIQEINGKLEVTLKYKFPQFLEVTIHSATDLVKASTKQTFNPFVKLQISGMNELYRTKVQYNTSSPVWNECFSFTIRSQELRKRQLIFHVIDFNENDRNLSLGQAIFNLIDLDLQETNHGWLELADLKSGRHILSSRAQNVALQEFKQALIAHALAKCPTFLFEKQSGSKVVRLHNTKTRNEAKLLVVDAVPVY